GSLSSGRCGSPTRPDGTPMDEAWSPAALLPACWVLLLGCALLAALARWFDPVPRRIAAVFGAVVVALLARVLLAGMVLLPLGNLVGFVPFRELAPPTIPTHALQADQVHQIAPWQAEVRRQTEAGRWPLWNEHAGAGMPLMADPQAQSFQ